MPSETNAAAIDGFAVQNAAPTVVARCYFVWDTDHWVPRLYYKDSAGTIQSTDSSDSVNGGETWYCMIKYEQASGVDQDDGLTELYNVQDSGGFPGWGVADVSENTCDNDGDAMEYAKVDNKIDAGCRLVFDDMRYDADGTVSY